MYRHPSSYVARGMQHCPFYASCVYTRLLPTIPIAKHSARAAIAPRRDDYHRDEEVPAEPDCVRLTAKFGIVL
jgi:hypothetical protein